MSADKPNQNPNQNAGQEFVFDKFIAISLLVGLLAGFVIGNGVGANRAEKANNASSTDSMVFGGATTTSGTVGKDAMTGVMSSSDIATVGEQKAGNTVVISKLVLDKPYWVAIRDDSASVKYPYVLGAKKLAPGTYTDMSVYVSRKTEAGKKYDVVFYKDSPSFNYSSSDLVMKDGSLVHTTFEVK